MTYGGAFHIKTSSCARIPIPKDRLAAFTNFPNVTKDQALDETALTLFHPVVHDCFQLIGSRIELPVTMSSKANSPDWKV